MIRLRSHSVVQIARITCRVRQYAHVNFIQLLNTAKAFNRLNRFRFFAAVNSVALALCFRSISAFHREVDSGGNCYFLASGFLPGPVQCFPDLHPHVCFTVLVKTATVSRHIPDFQAGKWIFQMTWRNFWNRVAHYPFVLWLLTIFNKDFHSTFIPVIRFIWISIKRIKEIRVEWNSFQSFVLYGLI